MARYYAIHVRKGLEINVKKILLKNYAVHLENRGVQIIIPEKKAVQMTPIKGPDCLVTLPGYLIIKCHELTDDLYYLIRHTFGVIRVIRDSIPLKEIYDFLDVVTIPVSKNFSKLASKLLKEKGRLRIMFNTVLNFKRRKVMDVILNKGIYVRKVPILHLLN
ncbi:MAG: hypothetical protein CVU87_10355 [Firmicutes bacterium HGW-Firmicutes-12]|jgi:transcription antitermination factor NusG|nr:MAG: hypothetical protein CVU87_10355 [Firmicutes bacterium HGW-Firmicutes-12]